MENQMQEERPFRLRPGVSQPSLILVYLKFQNLLNREEGQDLVEYALIITLIALAAVTGIGKVATAVNTVFSKISTTLA